MRSMVFWVAAFGAGAARRGGPFAGQWLGEVA